MTRDDLNQGQFQVTIILSILKIGSSRGSVCIADLIGIYVSHTNKHINTSTKQYAGKAVLQFNNLFDCLLPSYKLRGSNLRVSTSERALLAHIYRQQGFLSRIWVSSRLCATHHTTLHSTARGYAKQQTMAVNPYKNAHGHIGLLDVRHTQNL